MKKDIKMGYHCCCEHNKEGIYT